MKLKHEISQLPNLSGINKHGRTLRERREQKAAKLENHSTRQ